MEPEKKIKTKLRDLLRAIAHRDVREAMKAHITLYHIGSTAIPYIKDTLFGLELSSENSALLTKSASELRYVAGLVSLIHDIDENESRRVTEQLIQNGCSATIIQRLKSINEFTLNDYLQYEIKSVKIFEYKKIKTLYEIQSRLEKWFRNVPDDDLKKIERIYVVNKTNDQDYAGYYMPTFYYVKLVWDVPGVKYNPVSWLRLLGVELTFYHEIGHHIHRHTLANKLKQEEEDEANSYTIRTFLSGRPMLYKVLWVIFKVINLFRRKLTLKKETD